MKRKNNKLFFGFLFMLIITIILLYKTLTKPDAPPRKKLWTHIVYTEISPENKRDVVVSHGLFNQMWSLFVAVELATILQRDLVVNNFYVNFTDTITSVPLSKVIDLGSLLVPTTDWAQDVSPTSSILAQHTYEPPPNSIEVLLKEERHVQDLEVGCLFNLQITNHKNDKHIQNIRFHPIFYEITSSFLRLHPKYQVIHYRMEGDFTGYFYNKFHFTNAHECRKHLFYGYKKALETRFDPDTPTLVVSHYYKDPNQPRDFDLQWKNIIHFTIPEEQKEKLCRHLGLPVSTVMREIDAVFDFILGTSSNVCGFIGCENSAFSQAVFSFKRGGDCFLVGLERK